MPRRLRVFFKGLGRLVGDYGQFVLSGKAANLTYVGGAASGFYIERVGSGTLYRTLQLAIDASISNDTIIGYPGTYVPDLTDGYDWSTRIKKPLTIRSAVVGQKVVIDTASVSGPGGGAIMYVQDGQSLTLEDFELKNNKHNDNYNAGLGTGVNTGTITLRRCKVQECSNGIFTSNVDSTCIMTLENCELVNNGTSAGYYHHMYIGNVTSLTLRGCWIHLTKNRTDYVNQYGAGNEWRASGGHLLKTRAKITTVEACRLTMETQATLPLDGDWWGANRCIDASNGGDLTVRGCYMEYRTGQNGGQGQAITWGAEGSVNLPGLVFELTRTFKVKIQQNTIVARSVNQSSVTNQHPLWVAIGNYGDDGSHVGLQPIPAPTEYSVVDNFFCGWLNNPPDVITYPLSGGGAAAYAISNTTNTCGALTLLTDAAAYNYTPLTRVVGSQNWAAYYYAHPTSFVARTDTDMGSVPSVSIAWPSSVPVSTFASVPITEANQIYGANVTPALAFIADSAIGSSFSPNINWNEDYGPGGGGLFTGGGHVTTDYPWAWVFDGSIPGWVSLNTSFPNDGGYGLASTATYATGSEGSTTQANMPPDAVGYDLPPISSRPYWLKPQPLDPRYPPNVVWGSKCSYGYPANFDMEFGEVQSGVPLGFHGWNSIFPIPAGKMGFSTKGGWGTICHHSITTMSGKGAAWGHRISANTGQWTRWPDRLPAFNVGNDMGAYMRAATDGNYSYTKWNSPTGPGSKSVKTDLTTGAMTVINHSDQQFSCNNLLIIPGTNLAVWLGATQVGPGGNIYGCTDGKAVVWACLMTEGSSQVKTIMVNNTMPTSSYWAETDKINESAFGQAGLAWVSEVGKLAAFHQAPPASTSGTWPMKLYWITPPANVATNYATGNWVVEEEALSIPVTDTKALSAANRSCLVASGLTCNAQYNSFAWSSKLKCFLWFPRPGGGMCFFIRTNKVP